MCSHGRIVAPFTDEDDYYRVATWSDPTGRLCECISQKAEKLAAAQIPYTPIPKNTMNCWGGVIDTARTCNSNYSTHCLLSACGIEHEFGGLFGSPVGWNHRIKRCIRWEVNGRCCRCLKTELIDGDWCGPAPKDPNVRKW